MAEHDEAHFRANDLFLILFVLAAGWLLIFQSHLF